MLDQKNWKVCKIYDFYKNCGYKSLDAWGWDKIWALYLRQVGFVARSLVK